ncbi:Protein FAR1-RELATED SEQUENCE 1 [Bienertia sinuspersici]
MKEKDGEDAVQEKAMECAEGVGRDDAVDDIIVRNECDEVFDVGSDVATGAGLDELDVEQCVGESNIEIRRGSVSGYNISDNATQREDVSDTTNVDGVVTPIVGSVYNSWEEVERMFKVMEHFTASMRSCVFNDIDARVPLANIHGSIARERDGLQNLPIMEDMRHVVDERRRLKMEEWYAELKEELKVVYDSFTKEEFDSRWEEVTSEYGIVNDEWLSGLFVERSMSIPEYLTPKRRMYNCVHNIKEKEIQCSCKMFETHGILCRHVIRVLDMNLYEEPHEMYVLRRWQKDIRRKHALVELCYHNPTKTENTKQFDKMNAVFDALAFNHVGDNDSVQSSEAMGSSTQEQHVQCGGTAVCGDPPVLKKKGRPKGTRYKSEGDIAQMMASASIKMTVTLNTNVSGKLSTPHAEANM